MSPSPGSSKPLWERHALLGHERENQRNEKGVPLACVYPSHSWHQEQGRWWKNNKGSKNQASEVKKKYILRESPSGDFPEFAAAQKTNELIAGKGTHLKKRILPTSRQAYLVTIFLYYELHIFL